MKHNFTIRIWKDETNVPKLSNLQSIVISDITILSKSSKFGGFCWHSANRKRYGYDYELSKQFNLVSGSHSAPNLTFKGEYIDIIVKNFPRYPAFYQDKNAARDYLNGFGYTNHMNNGFPKQLLYRKIEIIQQ